MFHHSSTRNVQYCEQTSYLQYPAEVVTIVLQISLFSRTNNTNDSSRLSACHYCHLTPLEPGAGNPHANKMNLLTEKHLSLSSAA